MTFVKNLDQIFWVIEYMCKAKKCKFWSTNTKPFFMESEANLKYSQKVSSHFGVSYKYVSKSVETYIVSSETCIVGSRLYNAKFGQQIQTHFFRKARLTLKLTKIFLLILKLPINSFWSLRKVSIDCDYCFFEFCECWTFNWIFNWG